MDSVFCTSPLPSIEYFYFLLKSEHVFIDGTERFQKQSNRNRFHILTATDVQSLFIPVKHNALYESQMQNVEIANVNNFKRTQWRCMESAYNNSAFFEYYKDDFEQIFFSGETNLFLYNKLLLTWALKQLKCDVKISYKTEEKKPENLKFNDFRSITSGKGFQIINSEFKSESYNQVFGYKYGFAPNLSIIDLIFNCGPAAMRYLQ